jgi:hypothetical protein
MSSLASTGTVMARSVPESLDGTRPLAWFSPSGSCEAGTSPLAEVSWLFGGSR